MERSRTRVQVGLSDHDRVVADVYALREFDHPLAGEPGSSCSEDPVDLVLRGRVATADDIAA